jgi:transcriptional adapter 1
LGDDWQKYLSHLRKFFRNGTKVEFDREIRSFLTHKQIFYHNNFLLTILQTSDVTEASQQAPATPTPIVKAEELPAQPQSVKRRRKNDEIVFQVHPINEFVRDAFDDPAKSSSVRYAAQELFLPDNSLILGRFLTSCWENSLEYVDDQAVEVIVQAVQIMLKNILTHTIMKRKHFKVTADKKFYFDLGCEIKDPTVRNSMTRVKVDQEVPVVERKASDEANFVSSFEDFNVRRKKISLLDVYRTLKDKNVIPCHSVAMMAIERITTAINC